MKAAIIGYGKMGHEIEKILLERGHSVALVIDTDNAADLNAANLAQADVALEFTMPTTAYGNIRTCIENATPVVSGTTGWTDRLPEMIGRVGGYGVRIAEVHHTQKKDAPSGTAITLAEGVIAGLPAKTEWVNYAPGIEHAANRIGSPAEATPRQVVIDSVREGMVPGIHTVTYESEDDILELKHTIKNRRTLAMGAVIAAEFLCGKQGVYSMDDLLK